MRGLNLMRPTGDSASDNGENGGIPSATSCFFVTGYAGKKTRSRDQDATHLRHPKASAGVGRKDHSTPSES